MDARESHALNPAGPGRFRVALLVAMAALAVAVTLCLPPWPQPAGYHSFVDRRTLLGVPNFFNVVSNAAFALVGAAGLWFLAGDAASARRGRPSGLAWQDRCTFGVMFAGVFLTALGSAGYHLRPDNAALFWDRLGMSVAFMGFLAGMIVERVSRNGGAALLVPLVVGGLASVAYWQWTERQGAGDLRFYALVQVFPLLVLPYLALALRPRYLAPAGLLAAAGWYALAKVAECLDGEVYALGGLLSGHTLKHLAAAAGAYWVLRTIVRGCRRPGQARSERAG